MDEYDKPFMEALNAIANALWVFAILLAIYVFIF